MTPHASTMTTDDELRLAPLQQQVEAVMRCGWWLTTGDVMDEIEDRFGVRPMKEGSMEKMRRNMRGRGWVIEVKSLGGGLFAYRATKLKSGQRQFVFSEVTT